MESVLSIHAAVADQSLALNFICAFTIAAGKPTEIMKSASDAAQCFQVVGETYGWPTQLLSDIKNQYRNVKCRRERCFLWSIEMHKSRTTAVIAGFFEG